MLLMNRNSGFSIDCGPHPNPSLLLRKQYLSLRELFQSQRERGLSTEMQTRPKKRRIMRRFIVAGGRYARRPLCISSMPQTVSVPPATSDRVSGSCSHSAAMSTAKTGMSVMYAAVLPAPRAAMPSKYQR